MIRFRLNGFQVMAASCLGLVMASVIGGQQAQAVTISFTSAQLLGALPFRNLSF